MNFITEYDMIVFEKGTWAICGEPPLFSNNEGSVTNGK